MTTVEEGQDIVGIGRRLPGAAATFVAYLLVGPLVGGGAVFLALTALDAIPPDFAHDPGSAFFFSCLTVLLPIAIAGALVAARQVMLRPITATLAAGLGASVGLVWSLFLASEGTTGTLSLLAFVGVTVATLVCWLPSRLFAGPQ